MPSLASYHRTEMPCIDSRLHRDPNDPSCRLRYRSAIQSSLWTASTALDFAWAVSMVMVEHQKEGQRSLIRRDERDEIRTRNTRIIKVF